jgi:hypothetical protein
MKKGQIFNITENIYIYKIKEQNQLRDEQNL